MFVKHSYFCTHVVALLLCLSLLLLSGCFVGTVSRLWVTRGQFKDFAKNFRMQAADSTIGPRLVFLDPKLKPVDLEVIASGRPPTELILDSAGEDSLWIWTWERRPQFAGPRISLIARFEQQRLQSIGVDPYFSRTLGDSTICLLVESFVSGDTDLDLSAKRVTCHLSESQMSRLPVIDAARLRDCFGKENRHRISEQMPGLRGYYYRYRLLGAPKEKSAMSFHSWLDPQQDELRYITMRIGGFRISFDFTQKLLPGDELETGQ